MRYRQMFLYLFCFVPALTCALWFTTCEIYKHKHSPLSFKNNETTLICACAYRSSAMPAISQMWPSGKQSCKTQQYWALSAHIAFAVCFCLSKLSNKCEPGFKNGFRGNWLVIIRALMSRALKQRQAKKSQARTMIKTGRCFSLDMLHSCYQDQQVCIVLQEGSYAMFMLAFALLNFCFPWPTSCHAWVIKFKLTSD